MKSIAYIFAGLLAYLPMSLAAGVDTDRVNALRERAGLASLEPSPVLDQAARQHAAYLDRHREPGKTPHGLSAHKQQPGLAGFTGEDPGARAVAARYPHRDVLENVSMGYADADEAIDGLMSAIYHRLTFLDLEADQLGVAVGEKSRVFVLGRSDLAKVCAEPPTQARYQTPVDCLGQTITRDYYLQMCRGIPERALFKASHPVTCPNGVRLQAEFMQQVCNDPPREARFIGHGRYYEACDNGTRLDARWFNALCENQPEHAVYRASGSYYEICDEQRAVHAEWLEAQCANVPDSGRYQDSGRYRRPCAEQTDVRVEYLDELDRAARLPSPELVIWPPQGATDVTPAFFIEEPDPLPDREVAGQPVSLQFNPAKVRTVTLEKFELYRLDGDRRAIVRDVRLLDQASDPHQLLGSHEFALFPLQRLAWSTRYLASVTAVLDGERRSFEWTFRTRGDELPMVIVGQTARSFVIDPGKPLRVYVPPDEQSKPTVLRTRTEFLRGNQVEVAIVDPNTLQVTLSLAFCDRIRMQFDDGRQAELVPQGCR